MNEAMNEAYSKYDEAVSESVIEFNTIPHCDSRILHAPQDGCAFCNERPKLQQLREQLNISYTGHKNGTYDCPAEYSRSLETINLWGGNVIKTEAILEEEDRRWAETWGKFEENKWGKFEEKKLEKRRKVRKEAQS